MLDANKVRSELQVEGDCEGGPRNIMVTFNDRPRHRWIFGANYDIHPVTIQGANDNSAAVIQLLQLAADLTAAGYAGELTICFWDLEEPSNGGVAQGSYSFARFLAESQQDDRCAEFVLVLDVCGVGDTIVISRSLFDADQAGRFEQVLRANNHPYQQFRTPPSDNVGLLRAGMSSVLASVLPEDEIDEGWPPQTWTRLHTPEDDIKHIWPQTMHMMRGYLRSWLRTLDRVEQ